MKQFFAKLSRRIIRSQLARSSPSGLLAIGNKKVVRCFKRAAAKSSAYQTLLKESGVSPEKINTITDFSSHCPLLAKVNTFKRFPISDLIANDISAGQVASILTSSGHGANGFAVGLSTANQLRSLPAMIDLGLDMAFNTDQRRTLLINCLPMGVTFQSNAVCVANVSVREDMACAIVEQAGALFDQIILCGDPLFLKRLCDYSQAKNVDWRRYRMNVIIGEETFAESFRTYLAKQLGIDLNDTDGGMIGSSMGVGELGLNLFNETRETIALRRACDKTTSLLVQLCGAHAAHAPLPTFLAFNPLRTFVEIINPDSDGVGELVVSVLDLKAPIPLMRYCTGDRASLMSHQTILNCIQRFDIGCAAPALPVIALHGRAKDVIAQGWHVDLFKSALYRRADIARNLSGAFRISHEAGRVCWKVQRAIDGDSDCAALANALKESFADMQGAQPSPLDVECINYADFPYGQSIDYERKFSYWLG